MLQIITPPQGKGGAITVHCSLHAVANIVTCRFLASVNDKAAFLHHHQYLLGKHNQTHALELGHAQNGNMTHAAALPSPERGKSHRPPPRHHESFHRDPIVMHYSFRHTQRDQSKRFQALVSSEVKYSALQRPMEHMCGRVFLEPRSVASLPIGRTVVGGGVASRKTNRARGLR